MYSANFFGGANYADGYATADNSLGPFTKSPDNPVFQENTDQGELLQEPDITWK